MEDWYEVNLKHPHFLVDRDYQDFVLFRLFKYVDVIDISLMDSYHSISAPFDSLESAEQFCRENDFVQGVQHSVDREMLTERKYITKQ